MLRHWEGDVFDYEENRKVMKQFKGRFPFTVHIAGSVDSPKWLENLCKLEEGDEFGIFDYGIYGHVGWCRIIESFLISVQDCLEQKGVPENLVKICDFKEKFGELKIYLGYAASDELDDETKLALSEAKREILLHRIALEKQSAETCIFCGSHTNVTMSKGGWIKPICWDCQQLEYDAFYDSWEDDGYESSRREHTKASLRARPHTNLLKVEPFIKLDTFDFDVEMRAYRTGSRSQLSSGERNDIDLIADAVADFLVFNDDDMPFWSPFYGEGVIKARLASDGEIIAKGEYLKGIVASIVEEAIYRGQELAKHAD